MQDKAQFFFMGDVSHEHIASAFKRKLKSSAAPSAAGYGVSTSSPDLCLQQNAQNKLPVEFVENYAEISKFRPLTMVVCLDSLSLEGIVQYIEGIKKTITNHQNFVRVVLISSESCQTSRLTTAQYYAYHLKADFPNNYICKSSFNFSNERELDANIDKMANIASSPNVEEVNSLFAHKVFERNVSGYANEKLDDLKQAIEDNLFLNISLGKHLSKEEFDSFSKKINELRISIQDHVKETSPRGPEYLKHKVFLNFVLCLVALIIACTLVLAPLVYLQAKRNMDHYRNPFKFFATNKNDEYNSEIATFSQEVINKASLMCA